MKISLLLKKRVTVMDETVIFLNSLIAEIQFSKLGIPRILSIFSSETSMQSLRFLSNFHDIGDYSDFHRLWEEGISAFAYYKSDETEKLLQLGTFLGTTDADNQINTIKLYLSYFNEYRDRAQSDYDKNGKISSLLGLFAGASVFILLL